MINLFWYSRPKMGIGSEKNFGDELSKYIVEKVSNKPVKWINPLNQSFFQRYFQKKYLAIGSILQFGTDDCIIWGSGLIEKKSKAPNAKYIAVRGPNTRKELIQRGYKIPQVYGDPGLLTPNFYYPKVEKEFALGIIPHYVEFENFKNQAKKTLNLDEVNIIDLRQNVETVITEILKCDTIISSSLHGIIIPHAYGIPTLRIKITNKIYGDGIKYKDYFGSVGIKYYNPVPFNWNTFNPKEISNIIHTSLETSTVSRSTLERVKSDLLKVCPF